MIGRWSGPRRRYTPPILERRAPPPPLPPRPASVAPPPPAAAAAQRHYVIRQMEPQLAYLKSVVEGAPDIEPWKAWFDRNDDELQKGLPRTKYLDLKLNRIKAIPAILAMHGIGFRASDRYDYLGGV